MSTLSIDFIETFTVNGTRSNWVFVKISASDGTTGWGEASLEWRERSVVSAIDELKPMLIGQDPARIQYLWQMMYRQRFWRGGVVTMTAIAGIEQALWDLKGKHMQCPVHQLLGGAVRDRVRAYTHIMPNSADAIEEAVKPLLTQGFTAFKTLAFPSIPLKASRQQLEHAEHFMNTLRNAVGPDTDIMVDCHGRLGPFATRELAQLLRKYDLFFWEEPVLPENHQAMKAAVVNIDIPIATGERLFSKWEYREVFESNVVNVVQPDICHNGGILETFKIAAMAETYFVQVAPHNPNGPIATAASLHLCATIPNFHILEFVTADREARDAVCLTHHVPSEGYFKIPEEPGLGIEVDEKALLLRPPVAGSYPAEFLPDGTPIDA